MTFTLVFAVPPRQLSDIPSDVTDYDTNEIFAALLVDRFRTIKVGSRSAGSRNFDDFLERSGVQVRHS
jgi:hypothetical protein